MWEADSRWSHLLFYHLLVKICRSAHEVDVDHSDLSIKATLSKHMILWGMQTSSLVSLSSIHFYPVLPCFPRDFQVILKMLWQLSALGSSSTMIPSDWNPCLRIIKLQSVEGFPCTDEAFWHWVRPWFMLFKNEHSRRLEHQSNSCRYVDALICRYLSLNVLLTVHTSSSCLSCSTFASELSSVSYKKHCMIYMCFSCFFPWKGFSLSHSAELSSCPNMMCPEDEVIKPQTRNEMLPQPFAVQVFWDVWSNLHLVIACQCACWLLIIQQPANC